MTIDPGARTRSGRHTATIVFVVGLTVLAMGCAGGPETMTPRGSTAVTAAPTPRGSAPPTLPASGGTGSIGPSPASVGPPTASLAAEGPPSASLAAEGGEPVTGQLGSFTWAGGGSDSPWLPGVPIHVGAGEPLTVALGDDIPVTEWTARRVPAGNQDGSGAVPLGSGAGPIAFAAPGAGRWSVQVIVRFAADQGDAAYYWNVEVR